MAGPEPCAIFRGGAPFEAQDAARAFMKRVGFSMASSCANAPTACMFGDYLIAKWRNLTVAERRASHAIMTGDGRSGPLTITLTGNCPPDGREAFIREAQMSLPDQIPQWLLSALHQLVPAPRHFLIALDAHLERDLTVDSVAPLDLAEAIFSETGREVPDAEIDAWERVADVVVSAERARA